MSLNDFDKISEEDIVDEKVDEKSKDVKFVVDEAQMLEDIEYWLYNLDDLISSVKDSHYDYVNAKMRYEFKKNNLQINTNWTEENALRENNGLPKITAQGQRDAVIELKVKSLYVKMKDCEMKYKFYSKLFTFIGNNFELLCKLYPKPEFVGEPDSW